MVFFHGGAFTSGSGSEKSYGPEFLLMEDVILVTVSFRLGALGFLRFEDPELEVPGNASLKDQVMALKWVKKNIKNFGGDPENITVFGHSSGAGAVHYLCTSDQTKGLYPQKFPDLTINLLNTFQICSTRQSSWQGVPYATGEFLLCRKIGHFV